MRCVANGSIAPVRERHIATATTALHTQVSREAFPGEISGIEAAASSRLLMAINKKRSMQRDSMPSLGYGTSANETTVFTPKNSAKHQSMPSSLGFATSVNEMSISTGVVSNVVMTDLVSDVKRPATVSQVWLPRPAPVYIS
jgi:hypothetical protein